MFLHVDQAEYLSEYKLRLRFNNGVTKEVDLKKELTGPIFQPLQDPAFFRQVYVNEETNTIEWPNGADFAPEFLYKLGRELTPVKA